MFKQLQSKRRKPWEGEEEVRYAWIKAIEDVSGLSLDAERKRKDASYNHLIIEFKSPGAFNGKKTSPAFINATEQRLLPYIQREAAHAKIPESDFIGIAIDGEHIAFAQVIDGSIRSQHLLPFSETSFNLVVEAFKADTRKAFTIENLLKDFGHGSSTALNLMQAMADGLNEFLSQSNNKVSMLFEEWRTLYGQVANMSVSQVDAINKEVAFTWSGGALKEIPAKLFVIHTYNSFLIKILAADIVAAHNLTSFEYPAQALATVDSDNQLFDKLDAEIEHSGLFESAQISGFVEEVIFSWYLDLRHSNAAPNVHRSVRDLLSKVSLYRLDHLEKTRDILRDLYQGLVPGKLRQSLGEFYTPDWLVDITLDKVQSPALLKQRVLDPTCGSGAFLLAVIRRKRELAAELGWGSKEILDNICSTVWGFDLNPLAVQTARVNFLIEIADLLKDNPGYSFEVPILLADAIYSPAALPDKDKDIVEYNVGSQIANLNILLPRNLALDRVKLDNIFKYMEIGVEADKPFDLVQAQLVSYGLIHNDEIESWSSPLKHTYDQVLELHKKNWNGIWFKIVRNFFWSATAGQFDLVIGNPPWVRWSKLPDLYRERVKPTCEHYGIFSKTKRHGGNELDISAMITYTVADKWLKLDAMMAFVITGTLFKNPSSAGFRTFQIEGNNVESLYLQPISIDDLKALKPFPDAANHTCIAVFRKSESKPNYPITYNVWEAKKGAKKTIPADIQFQQILHNINIAIKEAFPVGEIGSPLAVLDIGRFSIIKYLSNQCTWTQGRKGITTDLNGVYFVPILNQSSDKVQIISRPEAGKRNIGAAKKTWVEPDLLYPLIKGAGDFEPYYLKLDNPDYKETRLYTFIPNVGISKEAYQTAQDKLSTPNLNLTATWFHGFQSLLETRSTYKLQMKGAPFFAIYNIGDYTFKPWKVIWPEMSSSFYAAVAGSSDVPLVGNRIYIPDHKVYFASFDDKQTAYFVCGLLNSPVVKEWINSHNVSIQVADVFKHLSIPEFSKSSAKHIELANLVESAHHTHDKDARKLIIRKIEELAENIMLGWSETL
ncbi:Eco57I restriction-modification methylase domain-containing protein [Aquirhabdus sp.]|uniref:Eco57I restriction-modification methylase domain-containing protein n=1 Tax=Aquirhabdus sp. TaxID=2824160 RepID=UPI00396C770F